MAIKDSYFHNTFSYYSDGLQATSPDHTSNSRIAQVFTATSTYYLRSIILPVMMEINLDPDSAMPDWVSVSVLGITNGKPDDSKTYATSTLTFPFTKGVAWWDDSTSHNDYNLRYAGFTKYLWEFEFSAARYELQSDTQYAIVLTTADDTTNTPRQATTRVNWLANDISDPRAGIYPPSFSKYSGGNVYSDRTFNNTWTNADFGVEDNVSAYFKIHGDATGEDFLMPTSDIKYTKKLVAFGNNEVWYETTPGTMTELTAANGDIDVTKQLQAFELAGKVFVANEENLKVADFQNVKITTTDIGANPPDHGSLITGGSSGAIMIVDYITALSGATTLYGKNVSAFTFSAGETVTGVDSDDNAISFTSTIEVAGPHWYDWTVYGNSDTYGTMPTKATLGCNYRGRAVLSGNDIYPHQWYMARQLNPWDWAYVALDAQTPVAGNNTDAGEVGDIIVSVTSYKDDYLLFGCASEMHCLTGDPAEGGSLYEIDLTVGMYGPKSYTFDKDGNFYFMGTDGIGVLKSRDLVLTNLSQASIPNLLKDEGLDQGTHRVTLGYDPIRKGIAVCMTKLSDGTNSNYWLDIASGGFFPESYPAVCAAYSQLYYKATDQTYKDLLFGCQDGYIRHFDDTAKSDVTTAGIAAIVSDVLMPVMDMSEEDEDGQGRMNSLTLVTAGGRASGSFQDTDGVTLDIHTADDSETVVEDVMDGATPLVTRTYSGTGRQKRLRKKARGKWVGMVLKNSTANETWALGRLSVKIKIAGRIK